MSKTLVAILAIDIVNTLDQHRLIPEPERQALRKNLRELGPVHLHKIKRALITQVRVETLSSLGPEMPGESREIKKVRRRISNALTRSTI